MSLVKSVGKQKVNLDFNKDFINLFTQKIKQKDIKFINQTLADLHAADVADLIENLDPETRNKLIELEEFNIDPDIFISDPLGKRRRNLTNHPGIDSSPAWSLTGQQIAFISDRTGTPQVWLMDSDGSNLRRVVKSGGHCDSPEWSPDGRLLAFSWQAPRQWKHDIFVVEVSTGAIRQVTTGWGSNEHPNWAPDGRHLTFQSDRTGSKQIFITNIIT